MKPPRVCVEEKEFWLRMCWITMFPLSKFSWYFSSGAQWRTQDFPEGGAPIPKLGLFCQLFAENCMKMKEFGPLGRGAFLALPLRSANGALYISPTNISLITVSNLIFWYHKAASATFRVTLKRKQKCVSTTSWHTIILHQVLKINQTLKKSNTSITRDMSHRCNWIDWSL